MPGYDKTGPMGKGPGTGGGRGFCEPGVRSDVNTGSSSVYGAGRGGAPYGGGRGRVWAGGRKQGNAGSFDDSGQENETVRLKNRAAVLEQELGRIKDRIIRLEAEK